MPEQPRSSGPGSLSEHPGGSDLFTEAPAEIYADAVVEEEGGELGAITEAETALAVARSLEAPTHRPKKLGFGFWLAITWLGIVIFSAVFADLLPLDPYDAIVGDPAAKPSASHIFGLDNTGRDVLSRVVYGARVSLIVGFTAIAFGFLIGGLLGMLAGYFRGRTEATIMMAVDVLLAFPALILALAIVTFLANGQAQLWHVVLAIGILSIAPLARLIRASTLVFAQREFVMAARTLGASNRRILFREILPNVVIPAGSFALIGVAVAIVAEGALAFLGLSVVPPTPTWGGMINEGRQVLEEAPHVSLIPAAVMFLTVLSLNFAGDRMRAFFDVKESAL